MKTATTICPYGVGIHLNQVEELCSLRRENEETVITKLIKNKRNWIESERCSIFWDGRGWSVNQMSYYEENFQMYEYKEMELSKAIQKFIECSQDDKMTKTDEEVIYEQDLFCNRKSNKRKNSR